MPDRTPASPTPARADGRRRRLPLALAAIATVVVGGMGVLHLPFARPALALFRGGGGCPIGVASASPQELERSRAHAMEGLRGKGPSPDRRAWQFLLGSTTRAQVEAWAATNGVPCKPELQGAALRCTNVAPAVVQALGATAINDMFLRFDAAGVLVATDVMRRPAPVEEGFRTFTDVADEVTRRLAAPPRGGGGSAEKLAEPYGQETVTYRFEDEAVDVSATNFDGQVVVREQYRSIPR